MEAGEIVHYSAPSHPFAEIKMGFFRSWEAVRNALTVLENVFTSMQVFCVCFFFTASLVRKFQCPLSEKCKLRQRHTLDTRE